MKCVNFGLANLYILKIDLAETFRTDIIFSGQKKGWGTCAVGFQKLSAQRITALLRSCQESMQEGGLIMSCKFHDGDSTRSGVMEVQTFGPPKMLFKFGLRQAFSPKFMRGFEPNLEVM